MPAIRESHAALFRKRPAQLITNRIKDYCHFYFFGIGVFPIMLCLAYNHIVYGTCELRDYPEGEPPHYWQFERTPVRQWWAKHFGLSDIEHHERNLAYYEKTGIQARWRQIEERVKHLESERWDYKAWSYQPTNMNNTDIIRSNLFVEAIALWQHASCDTCWESRLIFSVFQFRPCFQQKYRLSCNFCSDPDIYD
nr:Protein C25H3.9, isoform a [Haemonchus contortus]